MDHPQSSIIDHRLSIGRGFTLVECLIGLAISAVLLAAVAVAFNASVTSYVDNEDLFWTVNSARGALARMTSQIRNAGYPFEVSPGVFRIMAVDANEPSHRCRFWTADDHDFTFEFRAADGRLYLIDNDTEGEYVLCENVTAASFTKTPMDPGPDGWIDSKSVQILLTINKGGAPRTLSAAAVVRRNLGS